MTLGCLPHYRRLGVGEKLLNHILDQARKEKVDVVTLHVQTNNDAALRLYEKNGFTVVETKEGYYKKITPADAYVLERRMIE